MAKVTINKKRNIGEVSLLTSIDLDGSDEFCRAITLAVAKDANTEHEAETPSSSAPTPPADCLALAQQPPIYDLTLEGGEEAQLMEVAHVTDVNIMTGKTTHLALCIFVDCLADEYRTNTG